MPAFSSDVAADTPASAVGGRFPLAQGHNSTNGCRVLARLYPSCGEAVVCYVPTRARLLDAVEIAGRIGSYETAEHLEALLDGVGTKLGDPAENAARAGRRARTRMRRYMVHNRLCKMWVLSFAEPVYDYSEAMRLAAAFVRRLRRVLFRDRDFPYLYAPEVHPGGHGWHVNVMLQGVYLNKHQVQRIWEDVLRRAGRSSSCGYFGNVYFTDFSTDTHDPFGRKLPRRSGAGPRAGARRAARYGAKYIGKDFIPPHAQAAEEGDGVPSGDPSGHAGALPLRCERPTGSHRYELAQGFDPPAVDRWVLTIGEGLGLVSSHPSVGLITYRFDSRDDPDWKAPDTVFLSFDPPTRPVKGRSEAESRRRAGDP